jgi:hypothetical protein
MCPLLHAHRAQTTTAHRSQSRPGEEEKVCVCVWGLECWLRSSSGGKCISNTPYNNNAVKQYPNKTIAPAYLPDVPSVLLSARHSIYELICTLLYVFVMRASRGMVARNRAIIFSLWRGGSWGPNNHNNNTIRLEAGELTCSSASALLVQDHAAWKCAHSALWLTGKGAHDAALYFTSALQCGWCSLLLTACCVLAV